jgi:hypothetical protein
LIGHQEVGGVIKRVMDPSWGHQEGRGVNGMGLIGHQEGRGVTLKQREESHMHASVVLIAPHEVHIYV